RPPVIRYLAYRVGLLIPLLLGAALLIFLAGHYAPGDPVQVLLGDHYNPEVAAHKRHELGLDRPLVVQFTAYVARAATLDFGISYVNPARRVGDVVRETLPISLRRGALANYVLPVAVLAAAPIAYITRISRASVQQVLTEDYVRTARSKGLPGRAILARHVLRNAALPIVTTIGMAFGYAITGAFVVEVIFNIPGMARVAIDAILQRDYTVIQTAVLVYTALFTLINLAVDVSYAALNPRIRY